MTRWRGRKEPETAPLPAKETETDQGSVDILPPKPCPRKLLFLIQANGILDFLEQFGKALDTLEKAETLAGRDPGAPMTLHEAVETIEALEIIYGEDRL